MALFNLLAPSDAIWQNKTYHKASNIRHILAGIKLLLTQK